MRVPLERPLKQPKQQQPRPTYTVAEAAALLGIPKRTLYDYCHRDLIPHIQVVRRVLLLRETVDDWIAKGRITTKHRRREPAAAEPW